ncbi:mechanosensitive ion channel family protein [Paracidovorax citrulli]
MPVLILVLLLAAPAALAQQPASEPATETSAETSAAASSPAASAALAQSLDHVIRALEDQQQRDALVGQLRTLRDGVGTGASAPQAAASEADAGGDGLVGAIADAVEQVDDRLRKDRGPWHYWGWRLRFARDEMRSALHGHGTGNPMVSLQIFVVVLGAWVAMAALLHALATRPILRGRLSRRKPAGPPVRTNETAAQAAARAATEPVQIDGERRGLPPVPSWTDVAFYMLRHVGPLAVAFGLTVWITSRLSLQSPAGLMAMALAYSVVVGAVLSAVSQTLFAVFSGSHRRAAVRDLHRHSRVLLFAIGAMAAFGDATVNPRVVAAIGVNAGAVASTVANIAAALLMAWFCIRFRRAVGHLIANRPLAFRQVHAAMTDLLRLVGATWHLPALVIVTASVIGTLMVAGQADDYLRRTVISVGLIVVALVLTVFTGRSPKASQGMQQRPWQRRSIYVARFARFAMTLVRIGIWLTFIEMASRVWGNSMLELMQSTELGRRFGDAIFGALGTVLLAWLVWLLVDTAITQALSPNHGRGQPPSLRAKTILPLLRNAVLVGLLVIVLIAVLASIGVNVTPLLAGAGVVGLAIGFGAQTLVQDLITGLFMVIEDSVAIGDVIEVPDHSGTVEAMTIRTVKLRDAKGALHVLPYSQIKSVKNLSRGHAFAVFNIALRYDSDFDRALALIREAGAEIAEDVRYAHKLLTGLDILGLDRFDPSGPVILAQFKTRPLAQFEITRAFNGTLKHKFDEAGIRMASPYMTLQVDAANRSLVGDNGHELASGAEPAA